MAKPGSVAPGVTPVKKAAVDSSPDDKLEVQVDSIVERLDDVENSPNISPKTRAGARITLEPFHISDCSGSPREASIDATELSKLNAIDNLLSPAENLGKSIPEKIEVMDTVEVENKRSLPPSSGQLTLMQLAKDPGCKAEDFLRVAKLNPDELLWTDEIYAQAQRHAEGRGDEGAALTARQSPKGKSKTTKRKSRTFQANFARPKGSFLRAAGVADMEEGQGLTPVHHFLASCGDLTGEVITELDLLDDNFLARKTSLLRTPVHMFMASNPNITDDVLIEINNCISDAFTRRDANGKTPIDRYFTQQRGVMDLEKDAVVLSLCSMKGFWGVEALVKSLDGYTHGLLDGTLSRYKVYSDGNPFEVETFTKGVMSSAHPEAQTKFLLTFLPLRSPNKYGLSGTQSLGIMKKVLTSMVDCYSQSKDEGLKARWLDAFADLATLFIEDEGLLSGMVMDVPSNSSVEGLASTEFMSVVLQLKFSSGPVLLFWIEFTLFLAQFALILMQVLSASPELWAGILSLFLAAYFTGREAIQMYEMRRDEIAAYSKWDSQAQEAGASQADVAEVASLNVGDVVRILPKEEEKEKEKGKSSVRWSNSKLAGAELAIVVDPHWNGMVKVVVTNEEDGAKSVMKFQRHELFLVNPAPHLPPVLPQRPKKIVKPIRNGKFSRFLTVYLGVAVAYRVDPFNWIDISSTMMCWVTQILIIIEELGVTAAKMNNIESLRVLTVSLLSLKLLGFLRGTGIKMATFIIMFQEIIANVDSFVFVFVLILVMFSFVYHILLKDHDIGDDYDDDTADHSHFSQSLWNVWIYSLGEFEDAAYPNDQARALFSCLIYVIQIVLMNILIAIVSDSYTNAMARSAPLFWRSRVELIAEYEPLLPKIGNDEDDFLSLMNDKTQALYLSARTPPPKTWQYHCLMFQEGIIATGLMCVVVVVELLYVSELDDTGTFSKRFFGSLSVSLFFLAEICLRFYTWWSTVVQWADSYDTIGGFFTNHYRLIDSVLVLIDVLMLIVTMASSGTSADQTKAAVKFARVIRFARSARSLRGLKMLRSCRFFANLGNTWRQYSRPNKPDVVAELKECFLELEERKTWTGREATVEMKVKHDLERSVSEIIAGFNAVHAEAEKNRYETISNITKANEKAAAHRDVIVGDTAERLNAMEAKTQNRLRETDKKMDSIVTALRELKEGLGDRKTAPVSTLL
eukprot:CAMPEP_0171822042 /NCGR_PEP_ID=MMETSP0992-20121227/3649_1 /TAXON_ID=483369 /ORGANISM="non described non described, Strain CCMP2098" /LENGTH=1198 /DNA_ID=CAMNT_0012436593 /DNA_START=1 /DNA_END=3598 /DNA_ORIENTATION=+